MLPPVSVGASPPTTVGAGTIQLARGATVTIVAAPFTTVGAGTVHAAVTAAVAIVRRRVDVGTVHEAVAAPGVTVCGLPPVERAEAGTFQVALTAVIVGLAVPGTTVGAGTLQFATTPDSEMVRFLTTVGEATFHVALTAVWTRVTFLTTVGAGTAQVALTAVRTSVCVPETAAATCAG